ncbi:SPOR domain-containing protein [Caulobacter sp. 17J65-9]|uniref:SPOR domain-containing protein n=1 Tax=Caulobacter sp. 17J65-9 TaxID=2709382 RepID=UPI0013C89297|nr:SPOR domain-containing protein [Caulobacter sp. 17J65-9]NEX94113.1 SPOR domain-containing protein [Caulobacter sp. 17J65-9]
MSAHSASAEPTIDEAKVQVGAFASPAVAQGEAEKFRRLFPGGGGVEVTSISRDGKTFYRALVTGFASDAEAGAYCGRIKASGRDCLLRRGARLTVAAAAPALPVTPVMAETPPEQLDLICISEQIRSGDAAPIEIPAAARVPVRYSLDFSRRLMCDHRMCARASSAIQSADDQVIRVLQPGGATMVIRRADGGFTWTGPSGGVSVGHCQTAPFTARIWKTKS